MAELSRRPYLLRAMFDWMVDSAYTPHLIVDATIQGVQVPQAFVKDGRIVLNVGPSATQGFQIGADAVQFSARFNGVSHYLHVPVDAVLGIYARETGQGMVFTGEVDGPSGPGSPDPGPPVAPVPPVSEGSAPAPGRAGKGRPRLKVVK
ncbi:MAG: ClpXP protease specificity-enhancing factor [Steroidobacteraceae bacterium]